MKFSKSILEPILCKPAFEEADLPSDRMRVMRASTFAEMDVSPLLISEKSPRMVFDDGNEEDDFITNKRTLKLRNLLKHGLVCFKNQL